MGTPTYVVERVGDSYEVHPRPENRMEPALYAIGGSALVLFGLARRGFFGTALTALGSTLLYQSMTGCNPIAKLMKMLPHRKLESGPSYPNDECPSGQQPEDAIDEANMESFPASDPPNHSRTTAPPAVPVS